MIILRNKSSISAFYLRKTSSSILSDTIWHYARQVWGLVWRLGRAELKSLHR
jgi:hypothetical protein